MTSTCKTEECTESAVDLRGITKSYPHFKLDNVHLQIRPGSVAGLIGPNGAGKSTTMRIMMGLVCPDAGSVEVLGMPISPVEAAAKRDIGYFSEDMRLYKPETIGWHMQFVRSLYPQWDDSYADQLIQRFGLVAGQTIKGLSHGQRVKTMLLLILARRPKLLILDEPTNGLDPVAKQEVLTELMRIVEDPNRTLLYSSHNTADVEQISDWIAFIDRGRLIASSERDAFLENWKRIKIHVTDEWRPPELDGLRIETTFRSLRVLSVNRFEESLPSVLEKSGATIEAIEPMNLEEIFVSSVMRGREEASQ